MLTGIHALLTYMCNLRCDHCFVYSEPDAKGTFGLNQIRRVLDEAFKIATVKSIYFEGDVVTPFLRGSVFFYLSFFMYTVRIGKGMLIPSFL